MKRLDLHFYCLLLFASRNPQLIHWNDRMVTVRNVCAAATNAT